MEEKMIGWAILMLKIHSATDFISVEEDLGKVSTHMSGLQGMALT